MKLAEELRRRTALLATMVLVAIALVVATLVAYWIGRWAP